MNFLKEMKRTTFSSSMNKQPYRELIWGRAFKFECTAATMTTYGNLTREEVAARGMTCVCQMASATAQSAARMYTSDWEEEEKVCTWKNPSLTLALVLKRQNRDQHCNNDGQVDDSRKEEDGETSHLP